MKPAPVEKAYQGGRAEPRIGQMLENTTGVIRFQRKETPVEENGKSTRKIDESDGYKKIMRVK